MSKTDIEAIVDDIGGQAEDLCHLHDHVTRVIATLEEELFSPSGERNKSRCRSAALDRGHLDGGGPDGS